MIKRYDIYVGCNDNVEEAREKISLVLSEYEIGFSVIPMVGGYVHQDGTYSYESSILISIVAEEFNSKLIAEILKGAFNQESVLVAEKEIESNFVKE